MAKRSYTKKPSELEEPEFEYSEDNRPQWDVEFPEAEDEPQTTVLVLTKDIGTLNVTGPVSGTLYTFHGAGSRLPIKNEDVEGLLNKINPNNCCSGSVQQPYFILE